MIRTILIATVAALAITAPAEAQDRGERGKRGDQVEKAKARGAQRAQAPQRRAEASQQRAPKRAQTVQRQERAPRMERRSVERSAPERVRAPARVRSVERQERVQRAPRVERRVVERTTAPVRQRQQAAERRVRTIETRTQLRQTVERSARQIDNRAAAPKRVAETRERTIQQREVRQDRRAERIANTQQQQRVVDNRTIRPERRAAERRDMWDNLAQRRTARIDDSRSERRAARRVAKIGQRFDRDRYDDYVPFVYRTRYQDTSQQYYRYNDYAGYLYQVRRDNNLVSALVPLLGGAYSVGRPLPLSYSSYNVPYGYRSLYYDTPDHYYRYGSGGIYQVDSGTNLIQSIVALLSGQNFGVGQMLPASYNTYNVPYGYRDRYYDTADNWYRYNDGNIYQVDPRTRLIEDMYPMSYGGFAVGSPMPYGFDDYNVPYGYRDVYYDTPDYNYRYANGGIYQIDPTTQMVQALVALVTGQNYNVGQAMPNNYSVYNVPYGYRDRYADTSDSWYRYNDGTIYQLDPGTRVIRDRYNIYA